jgi:alpha-beta hydrolase superfamily lysophospholipase
LPVSHDELLNHLLREHAEEVRTAARVTRHMGLAARAGDHAGFAAAKAEFDAARKRSESLGLSIQICREMLEKRSGAGSRSGWSIVPPSAPAPILAPDLESGRKPIRIDPAA